MMLVGRLARQRLKTPYILKVKVTAWVPKPKRARCLPQRLMDDTSGGAVEGIETEPRTQIMTVQSREGDINNTPVLFICLQCLDRLTVIVFWKLQGCFNGSGK